MRFMGDLGLEGRVATGLLGHMNGEGSGNLVGTNVGDVEENIPHDSREDGQADVGSTAHGEKSGSGKDETKNTTNEQGTSGDQPREAFLQTCLNLVHLNTSYLLKIT